MCYCRGQHVLYCWLKFNVVWMFLAVSNTGGVWLFVALYSLIWCVAYTYLVFADACVYRSFQLINAVFLYGKSVHYNLINWIAGMDKLTKPSSRNLDPSSSTVVRLRQWFSTRGSCAFFLGVARASDKNIHNYFSFLCFVYGTIFCRSKNNRDHLTEMIAYFFIQNCFRNFQLIKATFTCGKSVSLQCPEL